MIDREKAIRLANEAGMINFGGANWQCVTDQIQQIITRAQNEAYEKAAECCECTSTADKIRSMKQNDGEKT